MAGSLATRITISADDRASSAMRNVANSAQSLCDRLEAMGSRARTAMGFLGVGAGGLAIGGVIKDATTAAARYDMLGAAMQRAGENAGYSNTQLSAAENALVRNGITLEKSRQLVMQLAASNIDLAKSSDLARTAQNLAVGANVNSSEAFERLVHGIVTAQPEMLRTLGLTVNFQQEYAKAAQAMGRTANSLTEQEKLQIRLNSSLQAGAGYAGVYDTAMTKAGKQLTSFERHFGNLKTLAGQVALPTLAEGIFSVNESLDGLNKRLMQMKDSGELEHMGQRIAGGFRSIGDNAIVAAMAVGMWTVANKAANSETTQRITLLSREHGFMATMKAELAGTTAMLGKDTSAYIANTEAIIANSKARLTELDKAIAGRKSAIAEFEGDSFHWTNRDSIMGRKQEERELKTFMAERVVVTRQLEQAEKNLHVASNKHCVALQAMGRGMTALGTKAMGVINMFGGPWVVGITAATAAVTYLWNQEGKAAKYARDHADAMQMVSQNADTAKAAIDAYRKKLEEMNSQQRKLEQRRIREATNDYLSDGLFGLVDAGAYRKAIGAIRPSMVFGEEYDEWLKKAKDITKILLPENFAAATSRQLEIARGAYQALGEQYNMTAEAMGKGLKVFDVGLTLKQQAEIASEGLIGMAGRADDVAKAIQGITNAAAIAMGDVNSLASIDFGNVAAKLQFDIDKTSLSKGYQAAVDMLIREGVDRNSIKIAGGAFTVEGLAPEQTAEYDKAIDLQQRLTTMHDKARGSAKSLSTALSSLNDELAKLTMTEQEYARYQYERKFSQLRKDLGVTSPALAEWARLQQIALDADYTGADAMSAHIRDVGKAIDEIGLSEAEKQVKGVREEFERLYAAMAAGMDTPYTLDQVKALESQRMREVRTGKTDQQLRTEFEKEFLEVMRSSEAAQIDSIHERARAYEAAGLDMVRVAQWQSEMELRYSRKATDGMVTALRDYGAEATNMAKNMGSVMTNMFEGMANAFSITADGIKFEWRSLLESMANNLAQSAIIKPLTGALSGGFGDLFGLSGGGGISFDSVTSLGSIVTGLFHDGGVIGGAASSYRAVPPGLFADAPRYHKGGQIGRREVPIISEVGEVMLSNRDVVDIVREKNKAAASGPVDLTVVLKNESGQQLQTRNQQTQWSGDMRSAVVTIVLDAVNRNYMGARDALRGA